MLVSAFIVLNLFIGVVVSALETERDADRMRRQEDAETLSETIGNASADLARVATAMEATRPDRPPAG